MNFFSHSVGNSIIPTDELIFFTGVGIPPTRNTFAYIIGPLKWFRAPSDHFTGAWRVQSGDGANE